MNKIYISYIHLALEATQRYDLYLVNIQYVLYHTTCRAHKSGRHTFTYTRKALFRGPRTPLHVIQSTDNASEQAWEGTKVAISSDRPHSQPTDNGISGPVGDKTVASKTPISWRLLPFSLYVFPEDSYRADAPPAPGLSLRQGSFPQFSARCPT
ncbi:hypothetical protein LZ30DRAFT_383157 [Colletotrichum cereale]|nr:hypothetical protein LZ30DRAFT_383157 [Colletotrichum cereale]